MNPTGTRSVPTANASPQPRSNVAPVPTATLTAPQPGAATVSAAATRAVQVSAVDQPSAVVEWWLLAYRGGQGAATFEAMTQSFLDQIRLSGGVRSALGVAPGDIRDFSVRPVAGATADQAQVEARLALTEGEVILLITLNRTSDGWRISRVETTG